MKKILLPALCGICLTVFPQDFSFDKNLTGWEKKGKNIAADEVIKTSRNYSLRLGSDSTATRKLKLDPDSEYEISFNIRGKGIGPGSAADGKKTAAFMILRGNKRGKLQGNFETGTFEWKRKKSLFACDVLGTTDVTMALVMRGKGEVWFDDIKIVKLNPNTARSAQYFRQAFTRDLKEAAVIPGGTFGFFDPGEPVKFTFLLDPWPEGLQFKCLVKDESGNQVLTQPLKKAGKTFTIPGQVPGYYVAEFEFYLKDKKIYRIQSAFAVNRPIVKRDPFFAGGFGAYQEFTDGLKRIGIGAINMKIISEVIGKSYTAEELVDLNMRRGHRKFIESGDFVLSAVFSGTVVQKNNPDKEKIKAGFPVSTDAYWNNFAAVAEAYVKRNRGKIQNYVIQSEIPSQAGHKERNCGTFTEAMFNLMISTRIVSRIVRRLDPKAGIWFGGNNRMEYQNSTERIVAEDLVNDIDGLIIDGYTGNWYLAPGVGYRIPEEKLLEFYRLASDLSEQLKLPQGRSIRNEELGYAMRYGEPFDGKYAVLQAALSARNLILSKASSVQLMEIHTPMRFLPKAPQDEDRYMGTIWRPCWYQGTGRTQVVPLPGGAMYAAAASELAFAQCRDKIVSGSLYAYVFTKPDGQSLAVIWNTDRKQDFHIEIPSQARLVNMYGREFQLTKGKNVMQVGPEPCYLTLPVKAEKTAALMREAVKNNSPECLCRAYYDSVSRIRVFVRNQTDRTLGGKLVFPGMNDQTVSILPGKVSSFLLPVKSAGKLISDTGREYPVPLEKLSVYPVKKLPNKPVFNGTGDWLKGLQSGSLEYPDAIRPSDALQEERCYFKTPGNPNGHNVSARYWTAYDEENFYLAVEVDDPVHQQRYTGSGIWMDDSIQFAFTTENFLPKEFRSVPDRDSGTVFNFCAALTAKGPEYRKMNGPDAGLKSYPAAITRKNGRTLYELAVPFKVFGGFPKRFGFVVFDNNYPELKIAPYWLEFSPGVTSHKDPSHLRLLDWK